jgi:hypothetical protein
MEDLMRKQNPNFAYDSFVAWIAKIAAGDNILTSPLFENTATAPTPIPKSDVVVNGELHRAEKAVSSTPTSAAKDRTKTPIVKSKGVIPVCRQHMSGMCKYGAKCKFRHIPLPPRPLSKDATDPEEN